MIQVVLSIVSPTWVPTGALAWDNRKIWCACMGCVHDFISRHRHRLAFVAAFQLVAEGLIYMFCWTTIIPARDGAPCGNDYHDDLNAWDAIHLLSSYLWLVLWFSKTLVSFCNALWLQHISLQIRILLACMPFKGRQVIQATCMD